MSTPLETRFQRLFDRPAAATFSSLSARYSEPQRRYHTLEHIEECLHWMDAAPATGSERLIALAIWWHDAVYDPTKAGNETASADLAREQLAALGVSSDEISEVCRLIELTSGHHVDPSDVVGARLCSIDLAILGQPAPKYEIYVEQVRKEYGHVPDDAWRVGRSRVMNAFLSQVPIYADPWFFRKLETQALENIRGEIAELG